MPLSRHSVGTYLETSSHATCHETFSHSHLPSESLWTDPSLKCGITVCVRISTERKEKKHRQGEKAQAGNEWSNILPKILTSEEKATTTTIVFYLTVICLGSTQESVV